MTAREDILSAVRAGLGERKLDADRIRQEALALLDGSDVTRPTLATGSPVDVFAARVTSPKVGASIDRIGCINELPAAVARYLDAKGLKRAVALQPTHALNALDWTGIEVHSALAPDEPVGLGIALWGIAETGSVVFHSSDQTAILGNFLPLHHLVAVRAETVVPYLEDYAAAALQQGQKCPRNVNIITGASGTTDIEGSLVRGAHGPRYLHILMVGANLL